MDCKTARLLLEFARPLSPDLDSADAEGLHEHLADCPDCGPLYRAERSVEDHLARAMRAVPVPEGLEARLSDRLRRERRAWYRWRLWVPGGAAAAAAALLLAIFLGFGPHGTLPGVSLEELYHGLNNRAGATPAQIEDWFYSTYYVHTVVPPQFDYHFLAFYDLADFQGQRVPMLLFLRGQATARVYILSAKQFNLNAIQPAPGYPVELLPSDNPQFAYVVIYTSERLDWFFNKASGAAA
jgi:hypothetical protein